MLQHVAVKSRTVPARCAEILIVDDSIGDRELTKEAFERGHVPSQLHFVQDGEEALRFLQRKREYEHAPRPDLILLDLNLPKRDGRELLDTIKQDPMLRIIPVIVLTGSEDDSDVTMSYLLHVNCYIVKPAEFEQFAQVVNMIEQFWLKLVKLP